MTIDFGFEQVAAESSVNLPSQDCQLHAESRVTLRSHTTSDQQEEEKHVLSEQTRSQSSRETEGSTVRLQRSTRSGCVVKKPSYCETILATMTTTRRWMGVNVAGY